MAAKAPVKLNETNMWLVALPLGQPVTGESAYMYLSRNFEPGKKPGIIYFAGKSAGGYNVVGAGWCQELAQRGYPVICGDLGDIPTQVGTINGPGVWGCDAALAKADLLRDFLVTKGYTKAGAKFAVSGGSHGCIGAYAYARNYSAYVSCVMTGIGTADVEDIRANNRSGYQASIEGAAAYGSNANWQAARATHNPVEVAAWLQANGIPQMDYYSTTDPICVLATHQALKAANPALVQVSLGAVGHSFTGIGPLNSTSDSSKNQDIADWIEGNI